MGRELKRIRAASEVVLIFARVPLGRAREAPPEDLAALGGDVHWGVFDATLLREGVARTLLSGGDVAGSFPPGFDVPLPAALAKIARRARKRAREGAPPPPPAPLCPGALLAARVAAGEFDIPGTQLCSLSRYACARGFSHRFVNSHLRDHLLERGPLAGWLSVAEMVPVGNLSAAGEGWRGGSVAEWQWVVTRDAARRLHAIDFPLPLAP